MKAESRSFVGAFTFLAVAAAFAAFLVSSTPGTAEAEGIQWLDSPAEQVLGRAKNENKRVLLEVTAEWCPSCQTLDAEVLSTREGAEVAAGLLPLRLDFDDEANRRYIERYVILSLPTVVVLTPEGDQVGRIMGYDGRDDWLAKAREAVRAENPVPALRAAWKTQPDNTGAMLRLGKALLVRGSTAEGEGLLERAVLSSSAEESDRAAQALFILGRYHHRVKQDPATARHIWRELAARFPESEWAGGALWWYAKAQAELGRHEVGLAALLSRVEADPESVDAVVQWGSYVGRHEQLSDHRAAARAAVERLSKTANEEQREELAEVATKLKGM